MTLPTYHGPTLVRAMRATAHALDRDPASAVLKHLCLWADANGPSGGPELVVVATDGKFLLEHRVLPQGAPGTMNPSPRPLAVVGEPLPFGMSEGMILDWRSVNRVALTDLMTEPRPHKPGTTKARVFSLDRDGLHINGPGLAVSVLRAVSAGRDSAPAYLRNFPNYVSALAVAADAKLQPRVGLHSTYLTKLKEGLALREAPGYSAAMVMTQGRGLVFRPAAANSIGTKATALVMPISLPDPA